MTTVDWRQINAPVTAKVTAKEPWQMTWQELGNYERRQDTGGITSAAFTDKFIKKQHRAIVFNAIKEISLWLLKARLEFLATIS